MVSSRTRCARGCGHVDLVTTTTVGPPTRSLPGPPRRTHRSGRMSFDIRLERRLHVSPEVAFHHWVDADERRQWYLGDEDDWVVEAETDLRVGGAFRVRWGPNLDDAYQEDGTFEIVEPPHRVSYTSRFTPRTADEGDPFELPRHRHLRTRRRRHQASPRRDRLSLSRGARRLPARRQRTRPRVLRTHPHPSKRPATLTGRKQRSAQRRPPGDTNGRTMRR